MTIETIITAFVAALVGGGGIVGLLFGLARRYIERKIDGTQKALEAKKEAGRARKRIEKELVGAQTNLLIGLYNAVAGCGADWELELAYDRLLSVLNEKKKIEDQILLKEEE